MSNIKSKIFLMFFHLDLFFLLTVQCLFRQLVDSLINLQIIVLQIVKDLFSKMLKDCIVQDLLHFSKELEWLTKE